MTNEQREAIELAKEFTKMDFSNKMGWTGYYDAELKELSQAIDTVLSLIKENQNTIGELKEKLILENKAKNRAEEECKRLWYISSYSCYYDMQKELENKDKQIDLMAELVYKRFKAELLLEYGFENEEQIIKEFEKLVKEKGE